MSSTGCQIKEKGSPLANARRKKLRHQESEVDETRNTITTSHKCLILLIPVICAIAVRWPGTDDTTLTGELGKDLGEPGDAEARSTITITLSSEKFKRGRQCYEVRAEPRSIAADIFC